MPEQECVKKDGVLTGQEKAQIVLKELSDGTYQLTYSREGFTFEHNAILEKGKDYRIVMTSDKSTITGGEYSKWNQPNKLYVNGKLVSTLQGPKKPEGFSGTWWVDSPSLNIPLEKIGQNLHGTLDNLQLYNRVLSDAEVAALGSAGPADPDTPDEPEEPVDIALNKPVTASSYKADNLKPGNVVDGDGTTRWASNYNSSTNEPFEKEEWLQIDLEEKKPLDQIVLNWESAYAKRYTIQVSDDGETFRDVVDITDGKGGKETLDLDGAEGRYVRIAFHEAVPSNDSWKWNYGYSLFEIEVHAGRKHEQPEAADKRLLSAAIAYAETLDTEGVNEIVLNAFNKALGNAHSVMDDAAATQAEVDAAWRELTEIIHMMDFTTDKSELAALTAECDALDLTKYEDGAEKEAFIAALNHAHEVLNDPAALDEVSIAEAISTLSAAREALIPVTETIDLSVLEFIYNTVKDTDLSQYLEEGKTEFTEALAHAAEVLADPESQQQADDAASALNQAYLNLRLLPDEALLDKLEQFAAAVLSLDRSLFTVDELNRLDTAAANIQHRVAAHRNGSHQMDQTEAQKLADEADELMDLINSRVPENPEVKDPSTDPEKPSITPTPENPGDSQNGSKKPADNSSKSSSTAKSVKTAAHSGLFSAVAGLGVAAGLIEILRRRKQH